MCFIRFLRSGEIVVPSDSVFNVTNHSAGGDVQVDISNPNFLQVNIKASKTDRFRQGILFTWDRCVPCGISRTWWSRVLLHVLLFSSLMDDNYLTRARFVAAVRAALREVSIDDSKYSGHSFRIGAATIAALQGLPDSLIKTLGRWESSVYTIYIRTPRETLCGVSLLLLHTLKGLFFTGVGFVFVPIILSYLCCLISHVLTWVLLFCIQAFIGIRGLGRGSV